VANGTEDIEELVKTWQRFQKEGESMLSPGMKKMIASTIEYLEELKTLRRQKNG
jgi:hypothetical protein